MKVVKFVDLYKQYLSIKEEIDDAISAVIADSAYIKGKYVDEFESAFAASYGVDNCIGVGNGTDALYLALRALDIGPGDEVITVANSWVSSAEVICQVGATPIFADIEPDFMNIDVTDIEARITDVTRAIMPVHLYGQPADIERIMELARKYSLPVIEDCAQAHYARLNDKLVGTFGDISTFSFYPSKNLGAYGDGGAVLTRDESLARKIRILANHGAEKKHDHRVPGMNSRLDGLQAAVLLVKLKYIDQWTEMRIKHAGIYTEALKDLHAIKLQKVRPGGKHVFHVYSILADDRDLLKAFLENEGIETAIHYPISLPRMEAFRMYVQTDMTPLVATDYQNRYLSLPMYPELTDGEIKYIANSIKEFYQGSKTRENN